MYACMIFSKIIYLKCNVTVNKGTEKWSKARRVSEMEKQIGKQIIDRCQLDYKQTLIDYGRQMDRGQMKEFQQIDDRFVNGQIYNKQMEVGR